MLLQPLFNVLIVETTEQELLRFFSHCVFSYHYIDFSMLCSLFVYNHDKSYTAVGSWHAF